MDQIHFLISPFLFPYMEIKKCKKCGEYKKLTYFQKHPKAKDGYINMCKECNKENIIQSRNKWLEKNPNYTKNYNNNYYKNNREK